MWNISLYYTVNGIFVCLILRGMQGYTNEQKLYYDFHLMTLNIQVHIPIFWHKDAQWGYETYTYLIQQSTS